MRKRRTRQHVIEDLGFNHVEDKKIKAMEKVRVYNEIEATYGELAQILLQLGYKDTSNATLFRFVYKKRKSILQLPSRVPTDIVVKANLAAFSYLLYMQGIIADRDDLAKGIEKNRLKK